MANAVTLPSVRLANPIATVALPPVKDFAASKHFVVDISSKAKVKISYLGENFKKNFLSKVEKGVVPPEELVVSELHILSNCDADIITALGGEMRAEITLGQFFTAVEKQPDCESGTLLSNGLITICYVRNIDGVLLPVDVGALDHGWGFGSGPRDNPDFYFEGSRQYLSR